MRFVLGMAFVLACGVFIASQAQAQIRRPCRDSGQIYKECSDQQEGFHSALVEAKNTHKLLVVVIGADWCPWCVSLHKVLHDQGFIANAGQGYRFADIALYHDRDQLKSGNSVLHELMALSGSQQKFQGIPILAVVDPQKNKAVLLMNTESLETHSKKRAGHDPQKVYAALSDAQAALR